MVSFNPSLEALVFTNKPFVGDAEKSLEWDKLQKNITLSIYYLKSGITKQIDQVPAGSEFGQFSWDDENNLHYATVTGEKIYKAN